MGDLYRRAVKLVITQGEYGPEPGYSEGYVPVDYTEEDVRRLYMRLWLRHTHKGSRSPKVPWTAEDDAALRACASVVKEPRDGE